jgi:thiosulfate dehydrogenase
MLLSFGTFLAALVRPVSCRASGPEVVSPEGPWLERTITACDRRKTVVVEGAHPDRPLPPDKARQVAALLLDLMRFCNEEVRARMTVQQEIFLSVNGRPYERYVVGSELPYRRVHGKPHTPREEAIWKAEYEKLVREGDRLFHSSELGTNGISCDMCHPNAANTHPETYPKFQTQLNRMALLRDMANWCIENPLEGKPLADDDPRMKALEAYMLSQRKGVALAPGKH